MTNTKERVLVAIRDSNHDLSIGEIAEMAGVSRETVSKYVGVLVAEEKIELSRELGQAKLYRVKEHG